jgi:hypothetical protein
LLLYLNKLRQINISKFTKAHELLEDKFTFALTKYNKTIELILLILGVKFFLVNNFNNNNKEEKVSNVIVKGLLPKDKVQLNLLYFVDSCR